MFILFFKYEIYNYRFKLMKDFNKYIFLILLCLVSSNISAQYENEYSYAENEESQKGKIYITPEFGLQFGTVTRIEFAPIIGYYITDRFSAGTGIRYEYFYDKRDYLYSEPLATDIYGVKVFTRFDLINNMDEILPIGVDFSIFAHAEYEALNLERKYFDAPLYPDDGRFWFSTVLIGGGILQKTSPRTALSLMFLWDVDNSSKSPYVNPVIRMGVQIIF